MTAINIVMWLFLLSVACRECRAQLLLSSFLSAASDAYSLLDTSTYNKNVQPNSTVELYLRLTLMTLNEINIKEQSMSVTGYITMVWMDSRLNYTSSSPSLHGMTVDQSDLWKPIIIVENALNNVDPIHSEYSPVFISEGGRAVWSIMKIFQTSCNIDSTFYPFDVQTCTIALTTWGSTASQVSIKDSESMFSTINTEPYQKNGIWTLEETSFKLYLQTRETEEYSSIEYSFTFKRRANFYILIIMIPVCLLSLLSCAVFVLPPDSGEKVGFSLTVLLSFAVYLTLISENIPETSLTLSLLTIYVTTVFSLGIFTVLMTIFVLTFHHTPEDVPVGACLSKFTYVISKITCWKLSCCNRWSAVGIHPDGDTPVPGEPEVDCKERKDDKSRCQLTWREVALIWDRFFLITSLCVVLLCTFVAILWLLIPEKS